MPRHGPGPDLTPDAGFVEVADRCWVARHDFFDVNVGVVAGERGVLVVDTHACEVEARRVVDGVRRLGAGEVVAVVNTHVHFDHTFGNVVLAESYPGAALVAHEDAAAALPEHAEWAKREAAGDDTDARLADVAATRVRVPGQTFSSVHVLDLGDRLVELVHPGRGHTAGDAVVRVGDADFLFAGDLVESSPAHNQQSQQSQQSQQGQQGQQGQGQQGAPGFGEDCFPLEWPASLDLVLGLLGPDSVVVPGHGNPVDREFVDDQRLGVAAVAQAISDLAGRGVPESEALATGEWPYPTEMLTHAVARGYAHLPRSGRSLPLA